MKPSGTGGPDVPRLEESGAGASKEAGPADPWRTVKMPLAVRDQFREALQKVAKASEIAIEDWPEIGAPMSGSLIGKQVLALECLCTAINQLSVGQVRSFLAGGRSDGSE